MRRSLLAWYTRFLVRHSTWVLILGIALTVASLAVSLGLELHTSREDLSDSFLLAETAYDRFVSEFGSPNTLIVVVEPDGSGGVPTPAAYRAFVDQIAAALRAEPEFFSQVFSRLNLDSLEDHGLYYVQLDDLRGFEETARDLSGLGGLADANRLLARRIRRGLEEPAPASHVRGSLSAILPALRWEARFLDDPEAAVATLDEDLRNAKWASRPGVSPEGFLVSRDRSRFFVLAQPTRDTSSLDFIRPMVATARRAISDLEAAHPGLRAGITGSPALIQEEMSAIRRDGFLTTAVAALGVILLSLWAFHRVRMAPLVILSLAMGVSWSAGLVTLSIGYLSLITSSFAVVLIGLGVDYGAHLVCQYEIERGEGHRVQEALENSIGKTGPGLLTGAGTTAVAFFAITLMEFRGFAQLGFVAGSGVLLCLVAMMTVLPALLAKDGMRRDRRKAPRRPRQPPGDRVSRGVLRFPRAVLIVGLAATALLALEARRVGYNDNLEDLLPAGAESLRLQDALRDASDLSPDFAVVVADDRAELEQLQAAAPEGTAIARRESILDYLPRDAGAKLAVLERLRETVRALELPEPAGASPEPAALEASLAELEDALAEVEELAFSSGRASLLEEAGQGLAAVDDGRQAVAGASLELQAAWAKGQTELLRRARGWKKQVEHMASQEPPRLEDLPQALRTRLVGRSGTYLLYLYPERSLAEPGALGEFVADCRKVSEQATGPPVLLHEHAGQIRRGFGQAVLLGGLLATAILLLDFRRPGHVLLAMVPTGLGFVWMLGCMGLAGLEFNLANLIAVPLVLGVGVDNGVHVIHRYLQEGREGMTVVLQHTGRAILISSLTTMIGFGSLVLASHRGMASLGAILFFGVASCLITSTLLLPCLLRLVASRRTPAG